ncbi:TetR family transcriptional regulator [Pseudonocardiaceae bacterium YIM PH 21723]|nr:TetR family transcriptional regulator [Pseudonocardiaceae bacterium YIM PH 21723]
MPLSRDQVIDAAVELLNEVGLEKLTTRALTDRLGVQRGALYWHVKSKDDLLGAIAERICRPSLSVEADGRTSWEWLREFGLVYRRSLLAHRDGARIVAQAIARNAPMVVRLEETRPTFWPDELDEDTVDRYFDIVASYVAGFVLQEQAGPESPGEAAFTASLDTIILGIRTELGV